MQLAISMRSVHQSITQGEIGVLDFLKYAASLAVDGVELDSMYLQGVDVKEIQHVLAETGLKVSCYDIHHTMDALGENTHQPTLEHIKQELIAAEQLGAKYVQIVGEAFDSSASERDIKSLIMQLVDMVLPALQGKNLALAIENPESARFQSRHMSELLKQIDSPQVKVGFNMANSLMAGEDPEAALECLKDQIAHVRAVDVRMPHQDEVPQNGTYVGCVIGLGLVPLQRLFQVLHAQGYEGWISLEFTGLEEAHFGTEASLKNVRQYLIELQSDTMHPGESTETL
ncbi:MAG TPA: sugar phosphate isomerase/epimerase [Firmicutes bacterium]|jgi:sugar phosphate isomerase/epimerase|nr:sugar phosphate isomerase/epimerase [Bacillota bacterium]